MKPSGYPSLSSLPEATRRALNGTPLGGPKVRALEQPPNDSSGEIERLKLQVDSLSFALETAVKANAELQNALVLRIGNDASSSTSTSLYEPTGSLSQFDNSSATTSSSNSFKKMQQQQQSGRERGRTSPSNGISPFSHLSSQRGGGHLYSEHPDQWHRGLRSAKSRSPTTTTATRRSVSPVSSSSRQNQNQNSLNSISSASNSLADFGVAVSPPTAAATASTISNAIHRRALSSMPLHMPSSAPLPPTRSNYPLYSSSPAYKSRLGVYGGRGGSADLSGDRIAEEELMNRIWPGTLPSSSSFGPASALQYDPPSSTMLSSSSSSSSYGNSQSTSLQAPLGLLTVDKIVSSVRAEVDAAFSPQFQVPKRRGRSKSPSHSQNTLDDANLVVNNGDDLYSKLQQWRPPKASSSAISTEETYDEELSAINNEERNDNHHHHERTLSPLLTFVDRTSELRARVLQASAAPEPLLGHASDLVFAPSQPETKAVVHYAPYSASMNTPITTGLMSSTTKSGVTKKSSNSGSGTPSTGPTSNQIMSGRLTDVEKAIQRAAREAEREKKALNTLQASAARNSDLPVGTGYVPPTSSSSSSSSSYNANNTSANLYSNSIQSSSNSKESSLFDSSVMATALRSLTLGGDPHAPGSQPLSAQKSQTGGRGLGERISAIAADVKKQQQQQQLQQQQQQQQQQLQYNNNTSNSWMPSGIPMPAPPRRKVPLPPAPVLLRGSGQETAEAVLQRLNTAMESIDAEL